jgi:hypothetical protein
MNSEDLEGTSLLSQGSVLPSISLNELKKTTKMLCIVSIQTAIRTGYLLNRTIVQAS